MEIFEIITFIKTIKKIDTFEVFNSWNTLYFFLYIQMVFYFYVHQTLYHLCFQVLTTTFLFLLKGYRENILIFLCLFLQL